MSFDRLVGACLLYVAVMFAVAWAADRAARRGTGRWSEHPLIYTLSLSVYCSAWTFYGAVGNATRSGLEFATIYLGPTVVFAGSWWGLRRLVRVARMHRVTSIADLISARYGKSNLMAALLTGLALIASTPYLALQLQSVALSFGVFVPDTARPPGQLGLWVAAGLALFTILFGTRNLAADERHHGVVMAIALEAIVKLVAFLAVGAWVVWGLGGGIGTVLAGIDKMASDTGAVAHWGPAPDRWLALIMVSGAAVVCLPRMFQIMIVEAPDEDAMAVAGWAFPAYLFAMSLFVLPIAVVGQSVLPNANPDLYVLELPLSQGAEGLALLAFLGGFSSATAMVVISAIALSTMISNHWIVPAGLALRRSGERPEPEDLRGLVLNARRLAILAVIGAGAVYYQASGGTTALTAMGLVAFTGMAQMLPAMLGGLLWRRATRAGAYAGTLAGFAIWGLLIFLPSLQFTPPIELPRGDPLAQALFLSLGVNLLLFVGVSLATLPDPQERLQALSFVNAVAPEPMSDAQSGAASGALSEALLTLAGRIWGDDIALRSFRAEAERQGRSGFLPDPTPDFIAGFERRLAGSVGVATAQAMIGRVVGHRPVTMLDLMAVAGEAQRSRAETAQLQDDQAALRRTTRQLREANEQLTALSVQKDGFLNQISHELRTPMTSVRAFSEILMTPDLDDADRQRFAAIIRDEAGRLTGLLDDLLELSVLQSGRADIHVRVGNLHDLIVRALDAASATRPERVFTIDRDPPSEHVPVLTDTDRLIQVLINVITNARKYCDAARPVLTIRVRRIGEGGPEIDIIDNGSGVAPADQAMIFEKFARLGDSAQAGSAGLGLAICREIMAALGGSITYLPGRGGAAFRLSLPAKAPTIGQKTKNVHP